MMTLTAAEEGKERLMSTAKVAQRCVVLSTHGSDRASAYPMSSKITRWREGWGATFLDAQCQNQFAAVSAEGNIQSITPIGPKRRDNHCGGALVAAPSGDLHLIVGAHHGGFLHYRLRANADADAWEMLAEGIGDEGGEHAWSVAKGNAGRPGHLHGATYPSLLVDGRGRLHLFYRSRGWNGGAAYPYYVVYQRWDEREGWSAARPLVRGAVEEHNWTFHGCAIGPDQLLHCCFVHSLPLDAEDRLMPATPGGVQQYRAHQACYYGASHVWSPDGGDSWTQSGTALTVPAQMPELARIEGAKLDPARIEPSPTRPGGSYGNSYYNYMTLSAPLAARDGSLWLILHNQLNGSAELCRWRNGLWQREGLAASPRNFAEPLRFINFSALSQRNDGGLELALTVTGDLRGGNRPGFGTPGTTLLRISCGEDGAVQDQELVEQPGAKAVWLPNFERSEPGILGEAPALLCTRGLNAHDNYNDNRTEVLLYL